MRNRILIIFCLVGLSLPMAAQMRSAIEVSIGGGWSSLGYKIQTTQQDVLGANNGSWGMQAHIGYALLFNRHIGLGIGANLSHYGANASLSGTARWSNVTDAEGEQYNHLALIHSLRDKQDIYLVEIPLTLYLLFPISDFLSFDIQVGAKYGIPILHSASFIADIEHQGDYGIWGLNLYNVPGHGFYREQDFKGNYTIATQNQISSFVKLGLSYQIGTHTQIFGNIYGDYSFTNILSPGQAELGFRNDRAGMETIHAFMTDYHGITATNALSAKSHPMQLGIELGVRFVFPHRKSYPCRCYRY